MMYTHGTQLSEEVFTQRKVTGAQVGLIMGSRSDWEFFRPACAMLQRLSVPFEYGVVSAHRTDERMLNYAHHAYGRGIKVIIACAGGSAHLPGMVASMTLLPVLGVAPKKSDDFAVGSMICMPAGKPLAYMGGGSEPDKNAGAENAALFAARILSLSDTELSKRLRIYDDKLSATVPYAAHD